MVAKKHSGGRGQAFVVFEEQTAATAAMRGLSGQLFYKKALVSGHFSQAYECNGLTDGGDRTSHTRKRRRTLRWHVPTPHYRAKQRRYKLPNWSSRALRASTKR